MTVHGKYYAQPCNESKTSLITRNDSDFSIFISQKKNPSLKTKKKTLLERSIEIGENKQIIKCTIYREN